MPYITLFSVRFIPLAHIAETYAPRAPRKTIAIVLLYLAASTAFLELRSDVAAILAGQVPKDVTDASTPVDFIHVLDLGFLLPGLCVTAVLLLRRKPSGYALAPVFLSLLTIMSMELVSIMAVLGLKGFGMSYPMIIFFAVLGVGFTSLLGFYFSLARKTALAAAAG